MTSISTSSKPHHLDGCPDLTTSAMQTGRCRMHDVATRERTTMHHRRTLMVVLLLAVTVWPGRAALAATDTPPGKKITRHRADAQKPVQAARPRQPASCADFGAGFAPMPGSGSCIRVKGGLGIGAAHA